MAANDTGKTGRNSKATKLNITESSSAVKLEETMAEQEKEAANSGKKSAGKLELAAKKAVETHEETGLALRSEESGEIEVAESFASAGIRPIEASHLEIFGTILNNRPVMASHLRVVGFDLPGHRPVFASEIVVRDDLTLPGGRPITASDPRLINSDMVIGGRPIASNEIDDGEMLMGFID